MKAFSPITALLLVIAVLFSSCVTTKKYQEMETARNTCETEKAALKNEVIGLGTQNNELTARVEQLNAQNRQLVQDTALTGKELRLLAERYHRLNQSYNDLNDLLQSKTQTSSAEVQKLLAELQKSQEELQKKEDLLSRAEADLNTQRSNLDELGRQLAEKEIRMNELQGILNAKDSAVKALRSKVAEALIGFLDKGLTVEQKHGKVYVRMDEKLLFATGSFEVAVNGVDALKKLARVLEANPDVNIAIEGHTDNVQYRGASGPINDNWDLSVMRATAVVKILLKNSTIGARRLMAAGRSEFWPVDPGNTTEARAKNRRVEIILTPKLDELFQILENN
jgi:chemotaxis protein MotB